MLEYEKKKLNGATEADLASNDWLWPLDRKVDVPREFPNPNITLSMRLLAQDRDREAGKEVDQIDETQFVDEDVDEDEEEFDDDEDEEHDDEHEEDETEHHTRRGLTEREGETESAEPEYAQLTNTKPAVPVACGLHVFEERLSASASEFTALGLKPELVEELQRQFNITQPSDIQTLAVPAVLQGHDVIIAGQTGTGKTLAYLLPLLQRLRALQARADFKRRGQRTRVIIVVPNRELVAQIVV